MPSFESARVRQDVYLPDTVTVLVANYCIHKQENHLFCFWSLLLSDFTMKFARELNGNESLK